MSRRAAALVQLPSSHSCPSIAWDTPGSCTKNGFFSPTTTASQQLDETEIQLQGSGALWLVGLPPQQRRGKHGRGDAELKEHPAPSILLYLLSINTHSFASSEIYTHKNLLYKIHLMSPNRKMRTPPVTVNIWVMIILVKSNQPPPDMLKS